MIFPGAANTPLLHFFRTLYIVSNFSGRGRVSAEQTNSPLCFSLCLFALVRISFCQNLTLFLSFLRKMNKIGVYFVELSALYAIAPRRRSDSSDAPGRSRTGTGTGNHGGNGTGNGKGNPSCQPRQNAPRREISRDREAETEKEAELEYGIGINRFPHRETSIDLTGKIAQKNGNRTTLSAQRNRRRGLDYRTKKRVSTYS